MTEEEENGVVEAEDKSEPEDLNELEEEIIQVTSSEAREDSGKSGSRYCSHSEIHQAREDCRFVSGQSIRSSVSSMQSSTLQPKYGAGEDVRSKETEEANSSAPITSYKPPEDSGKSGSRHCSHSENNQTKKSHRVVSDDSVSPSKSQTEPIAQSEYDDLLDEVELLLDDPSEETDWDAENELIETIEAEEDEGVENYADDLSGSSSSSLAPTQEFEPNEANSTHPTVQKKTGQIDYTHPFDLLFDQPTEEIDWDRLIAAMKRSFGESGDEGKRETTPSTHSFASGHREPEENRKRNSVCGLKSEEVVGGDEEDAKDGRTEEIDIAGYGLTVYSGPHNLHSRRGVL
jgi:hypothetical protein